MKPCNSESNSKLMIPKVINGPCVHKAMREGSQKNKFTAEKKFNSIILILSKKSEWMNSKENNIEERFNG